MLTKKTSELTGPALDWAVAKCEDCLEDVELRHTSGLRQWQPSIKWSQGGPIIERERIGIEYTSASRWHAAIEWLSEPSYTEIGPTALIAAMRCYVASKLGEEIEVPDGL